jgi:hypothetical protein
MPSWLPGDDYLINFRKGDPFSKIDQGYARLPGAGYEALHPELKTRVLRPWPQQKSRAPAREAVTPTLAIDSEQSPAFLCSLFSLSLSRRRVFVLSFWPACCPYIVASRRRASLLASSCSPAHAHVT